MDKGLRHTLMGICILLTIQNGKSNGKIVIGKFFADIDHYYTSMDVDELLFFNHTLTTQEINSLYNI